MSAYDHDPDPAETNDWLLSLDGVIAHEGGERADFLLRALTDRARSRGVDSSPGVLSPYTNSILPDDGERIPPEESFIARNVAAYVRWNAMAMVARANKGDLALGGHIATYTSISAIYEVGFNWFFRGRRPRTALISSIFRGTASLVSMPGPLSRSA